MTDKFNQLLCSVALLACASWAIAGCAQAPRTTTVTNSSNPKDCRDLSTLAVVLPSGETGNWDRELLEHFGANLLFLCDGKPVTGLVRLPSSADDLPARGYLKNGRPYGTWSVGDSADKYVFTRYELNYEIDTLHFIDREYYHAGRRNSHLSRVSDSLAIDSIWLLPPNGQGLMVRWVSLITPKRFPFGEEFKTWHFDSLNTLMEYYLKDSIDIEWSDNENELDEKVRFCRCQGKGICVGVLKGRPWKLVEYGGPLGARVEYWPSSPDGNLYPNGVFKHFESSGQVHSVFVNVDPKHYVH